MTEKQRLSIVKDCIGNRLTIYDIKSRLKNAPYFFSKENMKGEKQTLKDFHVHKTETLGVYYVFAEKYQGRTERWFNAFTCMFYHSYELAVEGEK